MEQKNRVILGVDPGTLVMGYGLLAVEGNKPKLLAMGVLNLKKTADPYEKLHSIFNCITSLVEQYRPEELAIESPFFGKNVQSMLKLGRAQGVAISAALHCGLSVTEYAPLKIKMAITGNGKASKEQVADLLRRFLNIPQEQILPQLDATDALGAAYCHFLQSNNPVLPAKYKSWKDFISNNEKRVHK